MLLFSCIAMVVLDVTLLRPNSIYSNSNFCKILLWRLVMNVYTRSLFMIIVQDHLRPPPFEVSIRPIC